ncbi:sugar phosphate isomerase/epimerase [Paracoccus sp. Z330]|uniref:Sugar phosphate isomerase/epimerase n=1 Tax=Paracoccus onchidii TaxID=3017813 RepID=A0ABT4ZGH2_9RHOB|nr:sugar phosphate isomerase/epimerase family protein [Paracoccus onchidii]MDB6178464.1 sugar phosphate isomerase/epimerase [Paracoccus onchidii]
MKLGLGSYAFRWNIGIGGFRPSVPMTPMDVLDKAQALGLGLVQYADNIPLHLRDKAEIAELASEARQRGITLELGMQSFDAEGIRQYLDLCEILDARLLRIAFDAADAGLPIEQLATQFGPILDAAEARDVRLAIENHFNYPSPRLVRLLDAVDRPSLGICLDVANSICAREWPEHTIAMLAPYAINLHLKDYVIRPDENGVGFHIEGVQLGRGLTDIDWVLGQLDHMPQDAGVILEHWLPMQDSVNATLQAEHDWLDETVGTARKYLPAA